VPIVVRLLILFVGQADGLLFVLKQLLLFGKSKLLAHLYILIYLLKKRGLVQSKPIRRRPQAQLLDIQIALVQLMICGNSFHSLRQLWSDRRDWLVVELGRLTPEKRGLAYLVRRF